VADLVTCRLLRSQYGWIKMEGVFLDQHSNPSEEAKHEEVVLLVLQGGVESS